MGDFLWRHDYLRRLYNLSWWLRPGYLVFRLRGAVLSRRLRRVGVARHTARHLAFFALTGGPAGRAIYDELYDMYTIPGRAERVFKDAQKALDTFPTYWPGCIEEL